MCSSLALAVTGGGGGGVALSSSKTAQNIYKRGLQLPDGDASLISRFLSDFPRTPPPVWIDQQRNVCSEACLPLSPPLCLATRHNVTLFFVYFNFRCANGQVARSFLFCSCWAGCFSSSRERSAVFFPARGGSSAWGHGWGRGVSSICNVLHTARVSSVN